MKIVQLLIKKVPPVNSEVLVDLKNIESPACMPWFIVLPLKPLDFGIKKQSVLTMP